MHDTPAPPPASLFNVFNVNIARLRPPSLSLCLATTLPLSADTRRHCDNCDRPNRGAEDNVVSISQAFTNKSYKSNPRIRTLSPGQGLKDTKVLLDVVCVHQ